MAILMTLHYDIVNMKTPKEREQNAFKYIKSFEIFSMVMITRLK